MKRLGYLLATLLVSTALTAGTASADIEWCAEDPVFKVLGSHFRVTTNVAASASTVRGISYTVSLPSDAQGATSFHFPQGTGKIPANVVLVYNGAPVGDAPSFPVTVTIVVDGPAGASIRADLAGPDVTAASEYGNTGASLTLAFDVAAK